MWIILAFLSAALLGFYDVFKKESLKGNAVIPVLLLNTLFSSLIFLPFIILSSQNVIGEGSMFYCAPFQWEDQKYIILKSVIVLTSWLLAYFGLKHLPLTIVGPINATRPVMVLIGAMIIFAEHLNLWQWAGVIVALLGIELLKHTSKKEGISWAKNKWIYFVILANVMGAISGLYDKERQNFRRPSFGKRRAPAFKVVFGNRKAKVAGLVVGPRRPLQKRVQRRRLCGRGLQLPAQHL